MGLSVSACGNGGPSSPTPVPVVTPVVVAPAVVNAVVVTGATQLLEGRTSQLSASARAADGSVISASATMFSWHTANPSIATVSNTGLVTAAGAGATVISASYHGKTGELALTSVAVNLNPSKVRAVYLTPEDRPFRSDFATAIGDALLSVQGWYFDQAGRTFSIYQRAPDVCRCRGRPRHLSPIPTAKYWLPLGDVFRS